MVRETGVFEAFPDTMERLRSDGILLVAGYHMLYYGEILGVFEGQGTKDGG
jgi:hypothetical protein